PASNSLSESWRAVPHPRKTTHNDQSDQRLHRDQEAIRQHVIAAMNITQQAKLALAQADANGDGTMQGNTALLDGVRKIVGRKLFSTATQWYDFVKIAYCTGRRCALCRRSTKRNSQITTRLSAR
ncbi:MAG: hypothetical protein ABW168_17680, partial [Sedimenticola sp.]